MASMGWPELIIKFSTREEWRKTKFFNFLVGPACIPFTVKLLEIVVESNKEMERECAANIITNYIDIGQYGLLYGTEHVVQKYTEEYGRIIQQCPAFLNMCLKYMQEASLKVLLVEPTCGMIVVAGLVLASLNANQEWMEFTEVMANAFADYPNAFLYSYLLLLDCTPCEKIS